MCRGDDPASAQQLARGVFAGHETVIAGDLARSAKPSDIVERGDIGGGCDRPMNRTRATIRTPGNVCRELIQYRCPVGGLQDRRCGADRSLSRAPCAADEPVDPWAWPHECGSSEEQANGATFACPERVATTTQGFQESSEKQLEGRIES
jgi:hypothetical protein